MTIHDWIKTEPACIKIRQVSMYTCSGARRVKFKFDAWDFVANTDRFKWLYKFKFAVHVVPKFI